MHALSGCDTTSYPFGQRMATALKTLLADDYHGSADVLGEVGATKKDLIEAAGSYFIALYGQSPGASLKSARFQLFASKKKSLNVMALPPTSSMQLVAACASSPSPDHTLEGSRSTFASRRVG